MVLHLFLKRKKPELKKKYYIDCEETVNAAKKEGLSVCDYVEKMWDNVGATDKVIENMNQICGFAQYERICEIGPGTGRYLEKIVKLTNPKEYHIYEIDQGWADWLEKEYSPPVIKIKADGRSLKDTDCGSCDLVHAHGVFVYLSFLTSYEYFREMIRVCKNGGYIAFDFYDDNDFTFDIIKKWLDSDSRYPVLLNGNKIKSFFRTQGLGFKCEFVNKYGQSFSRYFVFKKEVD